MSSHPDQSQTGQPGALRQALHRLSVPTLLFGTVVLLASMTLSCVLTPDRFPVQVAGTVLRIGDLAQERRLLLEQQALLIDERREFRRRDDAPTLGMIRRLRRERPAVGTTWQHVLLALAEASAGGTRWSQDGVAYHQGVLQIEGDVRDLGGRSIQALAGIVDILRIVPGVRAVREPTYTTEPDPDGGSRSPATLHLTFDHADT